MLPPLNGLISGGALCAILATGWVSSPQSTLPELSVARAAIEQATQAGAARVAPGVLVAARERLEEAERLAGRDPQAARWRAGEAESDARLAQLTAQMAPPMTAWQIASR